MTYYLVTTKVEPTKVKGGEDVTVTVSVTLINVSHMVSTKVVFTDFDGMKYEKTATLQPGVKHDFVFTTKAPSKKGQYKGSYEVQYFAGSANGFVTDTRGVLYLEVTEDAPVPPNEEKLKRVDVTLPVQLVSNGTQVGEIRRERHHGHEILAVRGNVSSGDIVLDAIIDAIARHPGRQFRIGLSDYFTFTVNLYTSDPDVEDVILEVPKSISVTKPSGGEGNIFDYLNITISPNPVPAGGTFKVTIKPKPGLLEYFVTHVYSNPVPIKFNVGGVDTNAYNVGSNFVATAELKAPNQPGVYRIPIKVLGRW